MYNSYSSTRLPLFVFSIICMLQTCIYAERTAQFLYFKASSDAPKTAYLYQNSAEALEIELPGINFSPTVKLSAQAEQIVLLPKLLAEGEEMPEAAPRVKIALEWQKILFLVFENKNNPVMPIEVKAINADPKNFDKGDTLFVNFTDKNIGGTLGGEKFLLKAKAKKMFKTSRPHDTDFAAKLDFFDEYKKKKVRFIRQTWRHNALQRQVMFIYQPVGSKYISYHGCLIYNL